MVEIGKEFIYLVAFAKFCSSATFTLGYIYTVEFYPTKIRASGLGMATANARMAGILTPTLSIILS